MKIDRSILQANDQNIGDFGDPDKIESSINHLANTIDTNDSEVEVLKSDNSSNKGRLNVIEGDINTLKGDNTTNKSKISALESDNSSNKSRIGTLESDNTSNKQRITSNEGNISYNEARLDNLLRNTQQASEVVDARMKEDGTLYPILGDRLNAVDSQLAQTMKGLVDVEIYGAVADGMTDSTEAIKTAITKGDIIYFPNKHYKVTDELVFKHGQTIFAPNGVVLDGTNFLGVNGNNVVKVINEGANYTALPNVTIDLVKGEQQLTFLSAHNLNTGDIICLYDNTDYSWSSARTYYKKSEFCKVASIISDTEVLLDNPIFDNYDATTNVNFGIYKMNMGIFNVIGSLEVIQGKQGDYYAITIERVKDFNADLKAHAKNGSYTAINLSQCYNGHLKGTAIHEKLSTLGGDYGLAVSNCQHITADGYFHGARHGVTTGGGNGTGCIINRDINIKGTLKTLGNAQGLGLHGNIDIFTFDGVCFGGMAIAGMNSKVKGTVYGDSTGNCVQFSEVKGFNHDLSGLTCISKGNPSPKGVVDFGGTTAAEVNNMLGGTLDLSRVKIDAPSALVGIVVRARNAVVLPNEERNIDLSFSNIKLSTELGSLTYNIRDSSASKNFDSINESGMIFNVANRALLNVNNHFLKKQKGRTSFTITAGQTYKDVTVTFPNSYPDGYIPAISVNLEIGQSGTKPLIVRVSAVSKSSFIFTINNFDHTAFESSLSNYFSWVAQ
jgi:hypothetical protein